MYLYRVFIAYSRENRDLAEHLVRHLERLGLKPTLDKSLDLGTPFPEQIKGRIAFAHLFMPLVTEESADGPGCIKMSALLPHLTSR